MDVKNRLLALSRRRSGRIGLGLGGVFVLYLLIAGALGPPTASPLVSKPDATPISGKATIGVVPKSVNLPRETVALTRVDSTDAMAKRFEAANFDLEAVARGEDGVPRLFIHSLPGDFNKEMPVAQRKELFFSMMLPLALRVNNEIAAQRSALQTLRERVGAHEPLADAQHRWLSALAVRYRANEKPEGGGLVPVDAIAFDQLESRVRPLPTALILAQAAEETGWGRSRFARQGNALFGEWTWDQDNMMVPKERPEGRDYGVRKFETMLASTRAYAQNLNRKGPYKALRQIRSDMIANGKTPTAYQLAQGLTKYSARGQDYVTSLRTILEGNNLAERFAGAHFRGGDGFTLAQRDTGSGGH